MAAFELNSTNNTALRANQGVERGNIDHECTDDMDQRRLKEECIIAFKVYDSCRQQDCLAGAEIGPARAAEYTRIGDECINEGDVIDPPSNAAAVTIDRLRVKKIIIVEKEPNPFRNGFWDIDVKYVFAYRLTFRSADGCVIGCVHAESIFNKKLTMFGSVGSDLSIGSDLFSAFGNFGTLDAEPFVVVEAKAVALAAELKYQRRRSVGGEDFAPEPNQVLVTIGLFSIVKLFRIVDLTVESRGFCIPEECSDAPNMNPCDFFDRLDFPMDIFAPPQRPEFLAGISGNIPRRREKHKCEGCACHE